MTPNPNEATMRAYCLLPTFVLLFLPLFAQAQDHAQKGAPPAAQEEAERWLAAVDAGGYGASWDVAGRMLREAVSRKDWIRALADGREALGPVRERTLRRSKVEEDPEGAPQGTYALLEYATEHDHAAVKELVVLWRVPVTAGEPADTAWRVVGYNAEVIVRRDTSSTCPDDVPGRRTGGVVAGLGRDDDVRKARGRGHTARAGLVSSSCTAACSV